MRVHPQSPPGFDFRATVEAVRRGPADPLNWFDGRRWRRFFTLNSRSFLLEATWDDGLVLTTRAGTAPQALVVNAARLSLGLNDPGRGLTRHVPAPLTPVVQRVAGVLLPGHPSLFEALVQTILGQQLAAQVANRQRAAFVRALGTRHEIRGHDYWAFPDPAAVVDAGDPRLRALGLSRVKAHAIRAIAHALASGSLTEAHLSPLPTADAIGTLTDLPDVGRWTSEWVLLRAFRRFDVVPAGDLAIREATGSLLRSRAVPTEQQVRDAARAWSPYGGLVAYRLLHAYRLALG